MFKRQEGQKRDASLKAVVSRVDRFQARFRRTVRCESSFCLSYDRAESFW